MGCGCACGGCSLKMKQKMLRILEENIQTKAMTTYQLFRKKVRGKSFSDLGSVRASSKTDAIKKMIQKLPIQRGMYEYIAVPIKDGKIVQEGIAGRIKKSGTGKI